jgi:hypothetical protein
VKKPGTIRVVIGEPIDPQGKEPRKLTEEIRAAIESGLARIAVEQRASGAKAVGQ